MRTGIHEHRLGQGIPRSEEAGWPKYVKPDVCARDSPAHARARTASRSVGIRRRKCVCCLNAAKPTVLSAKTNEETTNAVLRATRTLRFGLHLKGIGDDVAVNPQEQGHVHLQTLRNGQARTDTDQIVEKGESGDSSGPYLLDNRTLLK